MSEPGAQPSTSEPVAAQTLRAAIDPQWSARAGLWGRLRADTARPTAPPDIVDRLGRCSWGCAQPFMGLRQLLRSRELLGTALAPIVFVASVCAVAVSTVDDDSPWTRPLAFFVMFASLAPLPAIVFGRHYARLTARMRDEFGYGPCVPYIKPMWQPIGETLAQSIILAIGVAPLTAVVKEFGWAGAAWAFVITAIWTIHWGVVEALDGARTLSPGDTVSAVERRCRRGRRPWFLRWLSPAPTGLLRIVVLPVQIVAEIVYGLSRGWEDELDLIERDPWTCAGFGIGALGLLLVPGLNLLLRPAVTIGAAHLRAHLELDRAANPGLNAANR